MRFAKGLGYLAGFLSLAFFNPSTSFSVLAQEEFIENSPSAAPDGLFEDELEPLDEVQPERPSSPPPPTANETNEFDRNGGSFAEPEPSPIQRSNNNRQSFPPPKTISAPAGSKDLPQLPGGKIPNPKEKLRLDFVQVEIEEVLKYFAERLQQRFIYDPAMLSGKITIVSPTEVTLREAWGAFLSALEVRGYIIFPAGPFLKLEKAANARKAAVPVIVGETPNDDSFVTRIITLKYLNVNDIRQAVRNLLSRTAGDVIEHAPTNTLILSDYAYNIRRIVRILNILDVEGFQEQLSVITLKYAAASDVARKVTEFFPAGGAGGVGRIRARATGEGAPSAGLGSSGGSSASVVSKIVPDDRTNSLIILGSERGIEQVKKFIDQIDVPVEGGGGQIHVYYLQNVKAEDISQTLAALAQGLSKKASGGNSFGGLPSNPNIPNIPSGAGGPTTASLLSGEVKITADAPTNSLVIQASPRDFEVLKSIIQKLDIRRRQVFIESAILEAKVGNKSTFGTQAYGPFGRTGFLQKDASGSDAAVKSAGIFSIGSLAGSLDSLLQRPGDLTGLALGFRSGGSYNIQSSDGKGGTIDTKVPLLSAIIRLASTSENLNVLSTPHILATANEEATISIGEEIPQITGSTKTDGGATTNSYTRVRVATELNITPQINADDYLTLKIKQKVNSVGTQSADGQYNTINREASTTAIVKDQQTIVIGGLMEDRKTVTETKIPFLGDIPILGWLFKSRDTKKDKVNFLLFLTPHIIKDIGNMKDQFFRKLKERQEFLKEIGMNEQMGVPVGGMTDEQVKMLDKEYVKSLNRMQFDVLPQVQDPAEVQQNPAKVEPEIKLVEPRVVPEEARKIPSLEVQPAPAPVEIPAPQIEVPAPKLEIPEAPQAPQGLKEVAPAPQGLKEAPQAPQGEVPPLLPPGPELLDTPPEEGPRKAM